MEELYTTRMLGLSYLQRNQLAEAEVEFKKLTDLAPDDPLGYADLGKQYPSVCQFFEEDMYEALKLGAKKLRKYAKIILVVGKLSK